MKKVMAIVLLAFLSVTLLMATAQKNELTKKLIGSIMLNNIDEVKKLIEAGADLNEKFDFGASKGVTVLLFAVMGGYSPKADMLKVLIDAGADVNVKYEGSMTLLHVAAQYGGDKAVTELLIAKGLDVNAKIMRRDLEGTTPLHTAAARGNIEVTEVLIKNGAEVNAKLSDSQFCEKRLYTPLHFAAQNGHKEVAELLITKGADINAKDFPSQYTPLHLAVRKNHKAVVELLITKGADVNAKMKEGRTPLDDAINSDNKELIDLLRKHGAISGFK